MNTILYSFVHKPVCVLQQTPSSSQHDVQQSHKTSSRWQSASKISSCWKLAGRSHMALKVPNKWLWDTINSVNSGNPSPKVGGNSPSSLLWLRRNDSMFCKPDSSLGISPVSSFWAKIKGFQKQGVSFEKMQNEERKSSQGKDSINRRLLSSLT